MVSLEFLDNLEETVKEDLQGHPDHLGHRLKETIFQFRVPRGLLGHQDHLDYLWLDRKENQELVEVTSLAKETITELDRVRKIHWS